MKAEGPSRGRKLLVSFVRIAVIIQLTVMIFFWFAQDRMIFPGHANQGTPDGQVNAPVDADLIPLTTASGVRTAGLFGAALTAMGKPRRDSARRPTILYFYGNAECIGQTVGTLFQSLRCMGYNVFVPEYVGYGVADGSPSERGCYETADAAYAWLAARKEFDVRNLVIVGWSLGSAVAIDLASRKPAVGLAILSAFTSIRDVAHRRHIMFPLDNLILRSRFESLPKISTVRCPIFIAHGERDSIVPFTMSNELANACRTPPTRLNLPKTDHVDLADCGGKVGREALAKFIDHL